MIIRECGIYETGTSQSYKGTDCRILPETPYQKIRFFGSILRDDFRSNSDIDVLIDLDYSVPTGFMEIAGMEIELSKMIGREVDLSTPDDLSDYFRDKVLSEAEVLYE